MGSGGKNVSYLEATIKNMRRLTYSPSSHAAVCRLNGERSSKVAEVATEVLLLAVAEVFVVDRVDRSRGQVVDVDCPVVDDVLEGGLINFAPLLWRQLGHRRGGSGVFYDVGFCLVFSAWRFAIIMTRIGRIFTERGWVPAEAEMDLRNGGSRLVELLDERLHF